MDRWSEPSSNPSLGCQFPTLDLFTDDMPRRWQIRPHDPVRIQQLEQRAKVPAVLAQLLICRGLSTPSAVQQFLDPKLSGLRDPAQLPGVPTAVELLWKSIENGQRIVVYGDYDADGMCATAILYRCLKLLNANVGYYVPNRLEEGYGLNDDALRSLAGQGTHTVITVDCGIASLNEAKTARELGLQLVVTDHHQMKSELPEASAIVHPQLPGHEYPFSGLCGAAVAFKLAWALCQQASGSEKVSPRLREFLITAVGLATVATVADVVPLLDENRILVRHGLVSLKNRPPLGMAKLTKITKLDSKPFLQSEDIAFTLAPRLNAAGRLGQAQLGVELLTTDSEQRASSLAEYIHELNGSRESLERRVYLAAHKQATEQFNPENDPALVLASRGWHTGVIGIVAGRLAEKYHCPVILIALDQLQTKPASGSARSAGVMNLNEALTACGHHLTAFGGHAAAAGLRIEESMIAHFRSDFCEYAASNITAANREATVSIDAETPLGSLTLNTVTQMERMAPFGHSNPRPVLCTTGVSLADRPRRIGGGERHMSVKLRQHGLTLRSIAFGQGEWADALAELDGPLDIAYRPIINVFRGRRSVELQLVDWRQAEVPLAAGNR